MLNENLKSLRKQKGITQEELAIKLNVVRQTISKWEKGLSVPDADMLINLADLLEVSTAQLLGDISDIPTDSEHNQIAHQLSKINEELAIKNKRSRTIWKVVLFVIIGIIVFNIILAIIASLSFISFSVMENKSETTTSQEQIFE